MPIVECPRCRENNREPNESILGSVLCIFRGRTCSLCGGIGYIRDEVILGIRYQLEDYRDVSIKNRQNVSNADKVEFERFLIKYSLLIEQGDVFYRKDIYNHAIKRYKEITKLPIPSSHLAVAWNRIGNAYYYLGEYVEAIGAYDTSIELDPSGASFDWQNKGYALKALGRDLEANVAFAEARKLGIKADTKS